MPHSPVSFFFIFYLALKFSRSPAAEESQERRERVLSDGHDCLLDVFVNVAMSVLLTSEHLFE